MENVSKHTQSTKVENGTAAGGKDAPAGRPCPRRLAVEKFSIFPRLIPKYQQIRLGVNSRPNTRSGFLRKLMRLRNQDKLAPYCAVRGFIRLI